MYKGDLMYKITFVCTGNTCRSPMAEAIAKKIYKEKNKDIEVSSKGISVFFKSPASTFAIEALKDYDIDLSNHISEQINVNDVESADVILTMTKSHKQYIIDMFSLAKSKIFTLNEFTFGSNDDISDPYGGDIEIYKNCCKEIYKCVLKLSDKI